MMKRTVAICGLMIAVAGALLAQDAEEIVRRADSATRYDSAYIEARMVNRDNFGDKTIAYRAWARGSNFLMEFVSDSEFGQKVLRTEDRVYHFFPDSEAVFTKGRGDSVVGLISYEDLTDESNLLDNYDATFDGEESINGIACYRIALSVKRGRRVAYPQQMVWIAMSDYTIWRVEMFTRSGQPLKTMQIREIGEFAGKRLPVDMVITDDVRVGVQSEIFIDAVDLDVDIPDSLFTRTELTR